MARHLFDHASTSPLRPEAAETLDRWNDLAARGELGDPSRIHAEGMQARVALETAREQVEQRGLVLGQHVERTVIRGLRRGHGLDW
jgi:cysteine sulfinate desulfinase/cysteine desulfurase-like protein